ncbi:MULTISPECIES: hypothetical protein [Alkalimonas]|uniref:Uncharacterized protein n=1 Tax=Alkalimonas mucilaginosa TaxID=3057676 RepID=A0ABU7JDI6_9GAMM|nr:hypothetical protein [Alkalimonas sp. MEB004]MEE2023761.1 hypothetical protein [Alkalimonas sp. MEB004]
MKKCLIAIVFSAIAASSWQLDASTKDYRLLTVAGYLNFYLLNLNACQDFHPAVRQSAYQAEAQLYPWLNKLQTKIEASNDFDSAMLAGIVLRRRAMLNDQIEDNDFTVDHCQAIVQILSTEGLDETLLSVLN